MDCGRFHNEIIKILHKNIIMLSFAIDNFRYELMSNGACILS